MKVQFMMFKLKAKWRELKYSLYNSDRYGGFKPIWLIYAVLGVGAVFSYVMIKWFTVAVLAIILLVVISKAVSKIFKHLRFIFETRNEGRVAETETILVNPGNHRHVTASAEITQPARRRR